MVTAAELFATTGPEEPHIIIGKDRVIKVPDSLKRIAVESDHDIETVTFECPRYWDEHDLSQMAIYINYMLSNKYSDSYPVSKITTDDNTMYFTWTISRNVTQVSGGITFLVCIKNTDSEGNEVNHWNSELCKDMYVSKGMETEPQIVEEQTDLVTELLLRMSTVEKINVQAEEMQQILTETRDAKDYCDETLAGLEDASEEFYNNYANAIKGNVSGNLIYVDDVSPMEHTVKCWVHGKNLFNGEVIAGIFGNATFYTYNQDPYISIKVYLKKGTYTLSISDTVYMARTILDDTYRIVGVTLSPENQYTFTVNNDGYVGFSMRRNPSAEWDNATNIQIEEGIIATEYAEYIDPSNTTVITCNKNFWDSKNLTYPRTVSGVTIDYDPNTQIYTFNGTSTSPGDIYIRPNGVDIMRINAGETWTLKVEVLDGTVDGVNTCSGKMSPLVNNQTYTNTIHANNTELCLTKTYTEVADITKMYFYVYASGITFSNFKCRVQFEPNKKSTSFEKSVGITEYNPDADGNVENVRSIHPCIVVKSNISNGSINIEYNRDTTKMFESYVLTDEAKSEIAALIENDMADILAVLNSYATSVIGGDS